MIEFKQVSKRFEADTNFLTDIDLTIPPGRLLGLLGSNGSGKSTLLRLLAGIYQIDSGHLTVNGADLFENLTYKQRLFFAPDEPYFPLLATLTQLRKTYATIYPAFDQTLYTQLVSRFGLPVNKNLNNFSKGQKRQALMVLALATRPKYLLLDEIFDGLDLVMKDLVRKAVMEQMATNHMTVIMTTHNISELSSLCDHLCLMHQGKLIVNRDMDQLDDSLTKVHMTLPPQWTTQSINQMMTDYASTSHTLMGNLLSFTSRLPKADLQAKLDTLNLGYCELTPASLDEIFLMELQQVGYGLPDTATEVTHGTAI